MGGSGTFLTIEEAEPPAGKKRATPRALHTAISRSILDLIWSSCGRGAFRQTAGDYLATERADARYEGLWEASTTELSWVFMDHAGCCNGSSYACYHWFDLCLRGYRERWDKMAEGRGYRIVSAPEPKGPLVFRSRYALHAHGQQPLCVPAFGAGQLDWVEDWEGPFWDDGSPRPTLAELPEPERASMMYAAITGLCGCGLCQGLKTWQSYLRSPTETLTAAWSALASREDFRTVACQAKDEVAHFDVWRTQPKGPPSVQVLADQLPSAPLGWELAGMCVRLA